MSKQLFESYPDTDVFYKTSDEQYFFAEHDAQAHAATLKDKTVEKVERDETEKASDQEPEVTEPEVREKNQNKSKSKAGKKQ